MIESELWSKMGKVYLRDKITNTTYLYDKVKYSITGGGILTFKTGINNENIICDTYGIRCIDDFLSRYDRFDVIASKY